ncbi:MAG: hypothetical protein LHW64_11650, partial [Candidatus Cloacimonetes bacterium]|nr:hypothetical protein [Candidatus Cloacimonadota bacterium]MDY0230738.1 hypothetical protein [Candidatus Cloacimonadaceae bacterium]
VNKKCAGIDVHRDFVSVTVRAHLILQIGSPFLHAALNQGSLSSPFLQISSPFLHIDGDIKVFMVTGSFL